MAAKGDESRSIPSAGRSNGALSVADLGDVEWPAPDGSGEVTTVPLDVAEPGQDPSDWPIPPQVNETPVPTMDDGLAGNRQVALTPFPNLNIQSGPLAPYQLPWSHSYRETRPFSSASTIEFQTMLGGVEANGERKDAFGWYNSILWSTPFWKEKGIGVQFAGTIEPTTYPQLLAEFSFGAFRRAVWEESAVNRFGWVNRVSWGFGFDGIWDSEEQIFVGQLRPQLAYAVASNRELGVWGGISLGQDLSSGHDLPMEVSTSDHVAFYYRHAFPSELDGTIFVGATENPGGFLVGGYLSYRLSPRAAFVLQGMNNWASEGGFSIYSGLRIYFSPLVELSMIAGNPSHRYRAFLRAPDHINVQLRKVPVE